jgi:hypothetical protein
MAVTVTYTDHDAGCFVDDWRGIFMVDRIVAIANEHGASIEHNATADCCEAKPKPDWRKGQVYIDTFAYCQFGVEYEDEATDYMNKHFAVEGHYWGNTESGDWGLWKDDDDDYGDSDYDG